jgi:hypothetical protein
MLIAAENELDIHRGASLIVLHAQLLARPIFLYVDGDMHFLGRKLLFHAASTG